MSGQGERAASRGAGGRTGAPRDRGQPALASEWACTLPLQAGHLPWEALEGPLSSLDMALPEGAPWVHGVPRVPHAESMGVRSRRL